MYRIVGSILGSVAAGVGLSAVMLLGEKVSGQPSELIELERKTARKLGIATRRGRAPATVTEQFVTHGGHLAFSALAGLVYAAVFDKRKGGLRSGAAYGVAFFVAAYGLAGPLLGLTPAPWREQPLRAVQHPIVHTLFGIAMAMAARRARRSA